MPIISSPYWIMSLDVCTKHCSSHLPCAECLETHDEDVCVELGESELIFLRHHKNKTPKDLFPPEWRGWMYQRMLN